MEPITTFFYTESELGAMTLTYCTGRDINNLLRSGKTLYEIYSPRLGNIFIAKIPYFPLSLLTGRINPLTRARDWENRGMGLRVTGSELALSTSNDVRLSNLFVRALQINDSVKKSSRANLQTFINSIANLTDSNDLIQKQCSRDEIRQNDLLRQTHPLTDIDLTGCYHLTDDELEDFAKKCPDLKRIYLGDCEKITDKGMAALAKHCPHLEVIELRNCNGIKNLESLNKCRKLYHVNLQGCGQIGDEAIKVLDCPALRTICLRNCQKITDRGIEALARHCPLLEKINLDHCEEITSQALVSLAENCPKLTDISISCCRKVDDQGVIALLEKCPLTRFNPAHCNLIGEKAITALLEKCSPLMEGNMCIQLPKCNVNDEALKILAKRYSDLQSIILLDCKVTLSGLIELSKKCPNLKKIDISSKQLEEHTTTSGAITIGLFIGIIVEEAPHLLSQLRANNESVLLPFLEKAIEIKREMKIKGESSQLILQRKLQRAQKKVEALRAQLLTLPRSDRLSEMDCEKAYCEELVKRYLQKKASESFLKSG